MKTYTVAGLDYTLLNNGGGSTAFDGAEVYQEQFKLGSQTLMPEPKAGPVDTKAPRPCVAPRG